MFSGGIFRKKVINSVHSWLVQHADVTADMFTLAVFAIQNKSMQAWQHSSVSHNQTGKGSVF